MKELEALKQKLTDAMISPPLTQGVIFCLTLLNEVESIKLKDDIHPSDRRIICHAERNI